MAERWRAVVGYPNYEVSDRGQVRNIRRNRLLTAHLRKGYPFVALSDSGKRRNIHVHRLVLCTFVGLPLKGEQADHIDNVRTNNALPNLRWITCTENNRRKRLFGHANRGEGHGNSKLTWRQVDAIRSSPLRNVDLAKLYGVTKVTIGYIRNGKSWMDRPSGT